MKLGNLIQQLQERCKEQGADCQVYVHDVCEEYMYAVSDVYDSLADDAAAADVVIEIDTSEPTEAA